MLTCLISERDTTPAQQSRVLVVEDHVPTRIAMARLLRAWGLEVRGVGTVAGAIAELDWPPACMVLDLMLADGSGLTVLGHVRTAAVPVRVAVVTATSDAALLAAAQRLGPELLLRKPVDLDQLAAFIAAC